MKRVLILLHIILCTCIVIQAKNYTVSSPDGKIKVTVTAGKLLSWSIDYNGERILNPSLMQMDIEGQTEQPGVNPKVIKAKTLKVNSEQTAVIPLKQRIIKDQYNQLTLTCKGNYAIVFRVYNNGAAYRFETSLKQPKVIINTETIEQNWTEGCKLYWPREKNQEYLTHCEAIFDELKLTASAGVAPLKFLAKIASDMNKPNGQFVIQPHEVEQFVKTLPLKKIPGVGKVTSERLLKMGLETCEEVQKLDQSILLNIFGKMGKRIWDFSHGIDDREIQAHRERKSIGVERTLSENIRHLEQGIALLDNLYTELIRRIERSAPNIPLTAFRKIGVKLKFEDFQVTTLEKTGLPLSLKSFQQLLEQIWKRSHGKSIRLVGLHVNLPEENHLEQMSLW